ncbi:uncharacterized protein LOC135117705 [Helicoverpa armigera]|uniref:uncharacterized protein LOC135117705 n=1 Tax=Helicoverpa armigera TaxID=29058 RepID=UPI003082DEFB
MNDDSIRPFGQTSSSRSKLSGEDQGSYLVQEPFWNPYGKFLIVISSLQGDLRVIFDVLLMFHVNNVVLLNGTGPGHLYTYNPFANYACGRYYDEIIGFGTCLNNRANLFPDKLVSGLRNCTFRVSFPHKPPFTVNPSIVKHLIRQQPLIGFEEKLLKVLAEQEHFNITYNDSYGKTFYSVILPNMTAVGPLSLLQTNKTDIIIGGMMLSPARYSAFSHVSGHFDYLDELIFAVRLADLVTNSKKIYLEFHPTVWLLLILVFIIYFILLIIVLRPKDKSLIMLKMLSSLVLHGCGMSCRYTVKWLVLIWLVFAVIINIFYQTSLYSLTNNPIREHQIDEEYELNNLKACIEPALVAYLRAEHIPNNITLSEEDINDCDNIARNVHKVGQNRKLYTVLRKMMFEFSKDHFTDPWGHSPIHTFTKPLSKTISAILLYKGFPTTHQLKEMSL